MCFVPDSLENSVKNEVEKALSQAIHVGARPMTVREWRTLMEAEGFKVEHEVSAPMHLLSDTCPSDQR